MLDAAAWASTDRFARLIVASAYQQRLVDRDDVAETLRRMPRVRRRALIRATASDAAGGSEAISELDFLALCRKGRLPTPSRQVIVAGADGRNRYRDATFEEWRVHVEIDGGQHMDVAGWWADMQRQNEIGTTGDRILRFPAWAIRNDPDAVLAQVRAALMAAGWRPPI